MANENTPESSWGERDSNKDLQELAFARRGCCFWFPCFRFNQPDSAWERISTSEKDECGEKETSSWIDKGFKAFKKLREWSELAAGPKWKTFIRRFNKSRSKTGKFQYDPLSYALNFDEGPLQNGHFEDDGLYRDFSSRYAAIPGTAKPPSVDRCPVVPVNVS